MAARRGFSLFELLVVISIIALLCALLMPVINLAREQARRTQCQARMHAIGLMCTAYATDNDQLLPATASANLYHGYHFRPFETDYRHDFGLTSLWLWGFIENGNLRIPVCPAGTMRAATTTNGVGETTYYWRSTANATRYLIGASARLALMVDRYYYVVLRPNHRAGLNVLFVDGSVRWKSDPEGKWSNTSFPGGNGVGPTFGRNDAPYGPITLYFDDLY